MPAANGLRGGANDWLFELVQDYFGTQLLLHPDMKKIARDVGSPTAEDKRLRRLIFGFHPHGIFPTTHIYLSSSPLFRNAFPNLWMNSMTASIIHIVPFMRDIAQWTGVVGRVAQDAAVPAAQYEPQLANRSWRPNGNVRIPLLGQGDYRGARQAQRHLPYCDSAWSRHGADVELWRAAHHGQCVLATHSAVF